MTIIYLEINIDSYLLEHLTYNPETKVFTVLTEKESWRLVKSQLQVPRRVRALFFFLKAFTSIRHQEI